MDRASPEDQRSIIVTLTLAAHRLMRRMLPAHVRRIGAVMAGPSLADRSLLEGLLKRIEARIADGGPE
jgi:DNA-binding MarR family transcriptional regulator